MNHLYILGTIVFTVLGQILGKWRMATIGKAIPDSLTGKLGFVFIRMIWDPYIIACYASAFIASIFWLLAMTKFEISYAYPFMSIAFVLVLIFSSIIFQEPITIYKIIGTALIISGIYIIYYKGGVS